MPAKCSGNVRVNKKHLVFLQIRIFIRFSLPQSRNSFITEEIKTKGKYQIYLVSSALNKKPVYCSCTILEKIKRLTGLTLPVV